MPDFEGRPIEGSSAKPVWLSGIAGLIFDDEVYALAVIDAFHKKIHEGKAFLASYKSPDASPIADNGTIVFYIAPDREIHLFFTAAAGGDAEIEVLDGPTITGGSTLSAFNLNRNHSDDAGIVLKRDPTVNADGTRIVDALLPGGTGGNAQGGLLGLRPGTEIELNEDRVYAVRLTNRAGNAQPMSLAIEYYSP